MGSGDWVDPKDVSSEIHKDVLAVVRVLTSSGWRLRRQGHKFYMYCPCGSDGAQLRVDGSPKSSTQRAKILARDARRCQVSTNCSGGGVRCCHLSTERAMLKP